MIRILLLSLLLSISLPVLAIHKCESGGKIIYSDVPCLDGKSSDLGAMADSSSASDVDKAKRQNAQEKSKLKQLENARHKREAQEEKQQLPIARAAAIQKKKCANLAQKKRWGDEDAAKASGKNLDAARLKARRLGEKYTLECGK